MTTEQGSDMAEPEPSSDPDDRVIGEMIKQARLDAGLSQRKLATRLRALTANHAVDQSSVSRWENGERIPQYWLPHLAAALKVPLERLKRGAREARRRRLSDDGS